MYNSITNSNSNGVWNMLVLSLLPIAASVQANCVTDSPELGDIGVLPVRLHDFRGRVR